MTVGIVMVCLVLFEHGWWLLLMCCSTDLSLIVLSLLWAQHDLYLVCSICASSYISTREPELRGSIFFFISSTMCYNVVSFLSFVITKKGEIVEYFGLDKGICILVITILKIEVFIICISVFWIQHLFSVWYISQLRLALSLARPSAD